MIRSSRLVGDTEALHSQYGTHLAIEVRVGMGCDPYSKILVWRINDGDKASLHPPFDNLRLGCHQTVQFGTRIIPKVRSAAQDLVGEYA